MVDIFDHFICLFGFFLIMPKPGSKQGKAEAAENANRTVEKKEKKGPMHLSKSAKKAKNIKANHGGKTDRKPL